ncbi:MAG: SAM-dependent methyltransferase [Mycobacteriales bacterium]
MGELTAVNRTAVGVAAVRAFESARADRLFDDPYARALSAGHVAAPTVGEPAAEQRRWLRAHVVLRTRFYDELLLGAAVDQIVLLAAGLDARAWRLPWPSGTTVYELDQPQVLSYKAERLAARPGVDRRAVAVDLRDDWPAALLGAGFDAARPAAWLVEGLLAYLGPAEARKLLADVTGLAAAGSVLGCERTGPMRRVAGTVSALWRGGLPEGATAVLSDLGWLAAETQCATLASRWARPDLDGINAELVTATRPG